MKGFNRSRPYNELPLLPPKAELETKEVLSKTIKASRALAQLNGAIRNLPNPSLFLDTLHLQEAKASSEIENIITTNDDLYQAVVADKMGFSRLEQRPFITTNLCVELVQCIKQNTAGIRNTLGTTLSNTQGEVIYTPPSGEQMIREKMTNLETFINENDSIDPLIKMAISHYQFEAIHPFSDGNGRTGRILLLLQLKLEKLLDAPVLFLSEYINEHKDMYYVGLRSVTENNDWSKFILYMLDMVEIAAIKGLERLESIVQLMDTTGQEIKEKLPKIYSKDLVEVIFKLPYTKRQNLIDAGLGTPKTVGNYLIALEEEGFLKSIRIGKEKLYLNLALMNILEN
jgi:Fic family protein